MTEETEKQKFSLGDIGLPEGQVDPAVWVVEQIDTKTGEDGKVDAMVAKEVAMGAALLIIGDKATLINNLRRAGYMVLEPEAKHNARLALNAIKLEFDTMAALDEAGKALEKVKTIFGGGAVE